MINIFEIGGKIALNGSKEAESAIDSLAEKGKKLAEKVGSGLATLTKATAAVVTAAGTAVVAVSKASLDAYADYEQLVGGVETLFGNANVSVEQFAETNNMSLEAAAAEMEHYGDQVEKALANAQNAYKTVGMSANEYMETSTSFAASLISSLGEHSYQAADYADMALADMADNANKMGTSLESIKNAYQGFSKQNYTMLDNLKLGYGGTKTEMERLLRDAEKIAGYSEGALDVSSFADIVDAIHIVQEEMGITGTTAEEAASTIQGSLSMTKAAWKNLLVGFADGNQDLDQLLDNLVTSATMTANNIVPRLAQILGGLSSALEKIMPVIAEQLPSLIEQLLPGVISGAVALVSGLIQSLPELLRIIIEQLPSIITQLSVALIETFPILLQTCKDLFGQIWDYIAVSLLGTSQDFDSTFEKIKKIFEDVWAVLQTVWINVGQPLWDMVESCVESVRAAFAERMPAIKGFVSDCFSDIQVFWEENLKPCLETIKNFIENTLAPAFETVFNDFIGPSIDTAFQTIKNLWENTLKPVFTGITDFLTGIFSGDIGQAFEGIVSIVEGIWDGMVEIVKSPINQVINFVNSFIRGLNKLSIPDWVPGFGGKGINIPLIPELAQGGVLEKGQMGFLEGNGAEAVVPLHQNKKWIHAVAEDMDNATSGANTAVLAVLQSILEQLTIIASMGITLDTGALVGALADPMDVRLGKIRAQKARA